MTSFSVETDAEFGRIGRLSTRHGEVTTPALFPVVNMIGGTTLDSGSSHRHLRDNLLDEDQLQGVMYQAMSFLDYGLTPDQLDDWREQTFRDHLSDRVSVDAPLFVDSGGFRLMNSDVFGSDPSTDDDWRIYTNPDSILKLQVDYGADIVATLDYPIPPDLEKSEQMERMNESIDSAIRCLQLIEEPDEITVRTAADEESVERLRRQKREGEPAVFVALHGHDYETIHWYVMQFLERVAENDVEQHFQGFAIGSLVPLRDKTETLVDIVQGATDAIPDGLRDELAVHVFGVAGKEASMLALLGVDSFDCSTHMQAARYRKYLVPETWERVKASAFETTFGETFPCGIDTCPLCTQTGEAVDETGAPLDPPTLAEYLLRDPTYGTDGFTKSAYYGWLARHNFEVYNDELRRVRAAIRDGRLLEYVIEFARRDDDIKRMLERTQVRDARLYERLERRGAYDLHPGPDVATQQTKLSDFGVSDAETSHSISLAHGPGDFDVFTREFEPPDREVLLILPCSKTKPYGESQSHRTVLSRLGQTRNRVHKVTVSGLFGPVPEEFETEEVVMEYEYVLAPQDTEQRQLVTDRLVRYLDRYGDDYEQIVGYATSKTYRDVIETALERTDRGTVLPRNPESLRLREHFRTTNVEQLVSQLRPDEPLRLSDVE